jgi:hypothetical protein
MHFIDDDTQIEEARFLEDGRHEELVRLAGPWELRAEASPLLVRLGVLELSSPLAGRKAEFLDDSYGELGALQDFAVSGL